ncbi:uncharacterized protein PV07_07547 [Cladophialophora immunda]|uniref:Heterokaryon incompatibility domain-containing protein n=1 Tax=Cladophialophora immunda TaxID=569365 RepID=A0A0D1ZIP0_9EURO|nr:uncharacterized protein PV07_07547 [Cladophialophora immunda]KIW27846.1 hypothetical protein PV07_07547 [Cladophialophora immunda]
MATGFSYSPLQPGEIRVLKPVLSRATATEQQQQPLSFEIVHVPLLSQPPYVALSYTWGAPDSRHHVCLDGQTFHVRRNLHDALQQIHRSKLVSKYLWVDAICINQGTDVEALAERSIQITQMRQIYEQATKVLVWLGTPANETNNQLAFPMMRYFVKLHRESIRRARPFRPAWWPRKVRTHGEDAADFLRTLPVATDKRIFDVQGSQTHRGWLGILALWESPWWTRTWVFQEATVPEPYKLRYIAGVAVLPPPSYKVTFLCGDQQTGWAELVTTRMVATSILSTPGLESGFLAATTVGAQDRASKLMRFRERRVQHATGSFLEVLDMFRHTECADPRDKVYAPMYLASDDVRDYIRPDYAGQTVLDVYVDVVRYCLARRGHELDSLGTVRPCQEAGGEVVATPQGVTSTLPSWVPNFAASAKLVPIPKSLYVPEKVAERAVTFYDTRGLPNHNLARVPCYRPLDEDTAPSSTKPRLQDGTNSTTLLVSGVHVDVLKDIIPNTGPDLEAVRSVARTKSQRWATEMDSTYAATGESYVDALNRTLALDVVYDELGRPSERGGKLDFAFMRRPRAELSLTEYRYQMNMRGARDNASVGRDIGRSERDYLLMIPNTAVVGDHVWALSGGKVLYLLRPVVNVGGGAGAPVPNRYRMVGECYAHGLMDGEIARRVHMGEARFQDISLV